MKSFKEYLRLNESIVDEYKEVRKQAILGDQLVYKFKSTTNQVPSSLISYIPPVRPPEIIPNTRLSHDGSLPTHYSSDYRQAITDLKDANFVDNNSHELAHAYQHQAQITDNTRRFQLSPSELIISAGMSPFDNDNPLWKLSQKIKQMRSRQPRLTGKDRQDRPSWASFTRNSAETRSDRRKNKRDQDLKKGGFDRGRPQYKIPYINSDVEVNARIIGHAALNLDFRRPDQPDTTQHMREVAYALRRAPMNTAGTKSAILDVRKKSYESFKLSELDRADVGYPVSVQSLKKGMRQYTRLIQHHESELPSDLHTPEGREAFIRTHSS
jgi:hypothetical protein